MSAEQPFEGMATEEIVAKVGKMMDEKLEDSPEGVAAMDELRKRTRRRIEE